MLRLIILMACCTMLAFLSQKFTRRNSLGNFETKDRFFFAVIVILMIIFAGMRTDYNDTASYVAAFNRSETFPAVLTNLEWKLGRNPGFKLLTAVIRTFTDDFHAYLLICSAIVFVLLLPFLRRYSVSFPLTIYFLFTAGYFLFTMAAIKQTMATAIVTVAIRCYFNKNRFWFVVFIILASLVHPYALLYLTVPILSKQIPWTRSTYFLIAATVIIAIAFNWFVGTILSVTDILGEGYSEESFVGEGVNIFRVLVYFVPVILSLIFRRKLFDKSTPMDNFFVNATIVCALIMFVGMFGNANMFARLAMYFDPILLLTLPWLLSHIQEDMKTKSITFLALIGYFGYFIYMTVLSKPFDEYFKYISFWDYLKSIIG